MDYQNEFERLLEESINALKITKPASVYSFDSDSDSDCDPNDLVQDDNCMEYKTGTTHNMCPSGSDNHVKPRAEKDYQTMESDFDHGYDEDDFPQWPNGDMTKCYQTKPRNWRKNGWAFRQGDKTWKCRGVIICTRAECSVTLPAAVNNAVYTRQKETMDKLKHLGERCAVTSCGGLQMLHGECEAKCWYSEVDGVYTFKHAGIHNHEKPIVKKMTKIQKKKFEELVAQDPEKLPSKMITPELIAMCGEPCINTGYVGSQRRQYLDSEDAINKGIMKSKEHRNTWQRSFNSLTKDWSFVNYRCVNHTTVYSFRKDCMEEWLEDAIESQIQEGTEERIRIEGMCTDATFSYFREQNLYLISSVLFNHHLLRWVPYQLTISYTLNADAYKFHFFTVFDSVYEIVKHYVDGDERLLLVHHLTRTTVDHSSAQMQGFINGYVEFRSVLLGKTAKDDMSEDELNEVVEGWKTTASNLLRGCHVHFIRSVKEVSHNGNAVPATEKEQFRQKWEMLVKEDSRQQFEFETNQMYEQWPQLKSWLDWWLDPSRRHLVFDCYRHGMKRSDERTPATTNAVESTHSQYYLEIGKNNNLLEGLKGLSKYVDSKALGKDLVAKGYQLNYKKKEPWKDSNKPGNTTRRQYYSALRLQKRKQRNHGHQDLAKSGGENYINDGKPDKLQYNNLLVAFPGLTNSASFCFINASLMLIAHTFFREIKSHSSNFPPKGNKRLWKLFASLTDCLTTENSSTTSAASKKRNKFLEDTALTSHANGKAFRLNGSEMGDAPEFLDWLLEVLNKECQFKVEHCVERKESCSHCQQTKSSLISTSSICYFEPTFFPNRAYRLPQDLLESNSSHGQLKCGLCTNLHSELFSTLAILSLPFDHLILQIPVNTNHNLSTKISSTYKNYEFCGALLFSNQHYITVIKKGDDYFKCEDQVVGRLPGNYKQLEELVEQGGWVVRIVIYKSLQVKHAVSASPLLTETPELDAIHTSSTSGMSPSLQPLTFVPTMLPSQESAPASPIVIRGDTSASPSSKSPRPATCTDFAVYDSKKIGSKASVKEKRCRERIPAASLSKVFERLPLQLSTDVKSPLLVANTMGHHGTDDKPDSLRLKHESIILKPQELAALRNGDMLNDSVCDKYLYIIEDCISSQLSHCRIKFFGTFMYENLRIGSFSRAAEHYKHENMFTDYDLVVFLVHVSPMHWSAGFLLVRQKRIIYLDSLTQNDESTGDEFTEFICSWLEKEAKYKGMPFNRLEYCRLYIHNIPQQRNLVDCGVYACEFIRRTVLGLNVTSQVRVRKGLAIDLRKKMEDSLESGFLDEQSHTNNPVEQLLSSSSIFPQFAVLKQKTIWVWLQWEEDRKFYPAKVAKQSHDTITAVFDNKTKRNIRILSNAIYPLLLKVGDHVLAKKSKTESSEAKILRLDPLKGFDTEIEVEFVSGKKEKKVVMLAELAGCWKHVVKVVKDVKVIDRKGEVEGRVDLTSLP